MNPEDQDFDQGSDVPQEDNGTDQHQGQEDDRYSKSNPSKNNNTGNKRRGGQVAKSASDKIKEKIRENIDPRRRLSPKQLKKRFKQELKQVAKKTAKRIVKELAKKAAASPWTWIIIAIILLLIIIVVGITQSQIDEDESQCDGGPQMTVTMSGPDTAKNGDNLAYKIDVANSGGGTTITDKLPDGTSFVSADQGGTYDQGSNTVTWTMAADGSVNLNLKATKDNSNIINYAQTNGGGGTGGSGGTASGSANPASGGDTVIVLDPGHSGTDIKTTDPATGLTDHDYPNDKEITEVFDIAQKVKQKLEADGYKVVMTKNAANDSVSLRKRADIANGANAALAVSIHNDHGQPWGNFAQIYVQKVGNSRTTQGGKKVEFTNADVAQKSQNYGNILKTERTTAEGHNVDIVDPNFNNRPGLDPGNIPEVELFATVPWVYNEVGASGGDMTQDEIAKYTQGLVAGIEKAVPKSAAASNGGGCGGGASGQVTKGYVAPSDNTCGGKYNIAAPLTAKKNFGDPSCSFDKDKLYTLLKEVDPSNADKWFRVVVPCESSYNPNTFAAIAVDSAGAWGLYQMGSSRPPGSPPPAEGKNGPEDRGDVNWELQTSNAAAYLKKINGDWGKYWAGSKGCAASGGKSVNSL